MRYVPLYVIQDYLNLDDNEITNYESLAFDALGLMQFYPLLQIAMEVVEIENYKAPLPEDLVRLRKIAVLSENTTILDKDGNLIPELKCESCNDLPYSQSSQGLIEYHLCRIKHQGVVYVTDYNKFINQVDYKLAQIPRHRANPFSSKKHCHDCPNLLSTCSMTYQFSYSNELIFSCDGGFACIDYYKYAQDAEGNYLILDNPILIDALVSYVSFRHWERRWNLKEQGSRERMEMYRQRWIILKRRFESDLHMFFIDPLYINQEMYKDIKRARDIRTWNHQYKYYDR